MGAPSPASQTRLATTAGARQEPWQQEGRATHSQALTEVPLKYDSAISVRGFGRGANWMLLPLMAEVLILHHSSPGSFSKFDNIY